MSSISGRANRRKGKSVVFEMLPSFVTPEGATDEEALRPRRSPPWTSKMSQEAIREIIMVILGLALVVWLFFGGDNEVSPVSGELRWAGRPVHRAPSPIILPSHYGSSSSRDAIKKAPGDRNSPAKSDRNPDKSGRIPVYQYTGKDSPQLVLVTVLDDVKYPRDYCDKIIQNRVEYANEYGYGVLVRYASDYQKFLDETENHPSPSWARVPMAREAMATFANAKWFWFVDQTTLIMDPTKNILTEIINPSELSKKMLRDEDIVRDSPDVKTYKKNPAEDVELILSLDDKGLTSSSFIYKNSMLAKAWLEYWMDPLHRNYPWFHDDSAALHHMMQWHTRFLLNTAVIQPKELASLAFPPSGDLHDELMYSEGDLTGVIRCDFTTEACKREFQKYWNSRTRVANPLPVADKQPEGQDPAQAQAQQNAQAKAQAHAEAKAQQQEQTVADDGAVANAAAENRLGSLDKGAAVGSETGKGAEDAPPKIRKVTNGDNYASALTSKESASKSSDPASSKPSVSSNKPQNPNDRL